MPFKTELPKQLYTSLQSRQLDQTFINDHQVPGIVLMKRAGRALYNTAMALWPNQRVWVVVCGGGNNAGDGYIFAALAAQNKQAVQVVSVVDTATLKGDALRAHEYAVQEGVSVTPFTSDMPFSAGAVIVDALLGTGLSGEVRAPFTAAIDWVNQQKCAVISADVPSGINADTGATCGSAVFAGATVSFIALKQGLLTGAAVDHCGQVFFDDLNAPSDVYSTQKPSVHRVNIHDAVIPARKAAAHKGHTGHVMVVGGDRGYGGAGLLASESAAYSGAGLVSLATQPEHVTASLVRRPEVMAIGVPSGQELEPHLTAPSVFVVGPGLGQSPWSEQMLQQVLQGNKATVLDADALNILALGRLSLRAHSATRISTPHPGEAARLLGTSTQVIGEDRFKAVRELHSRLGGVVILKGAGTLIYDGNTTYLANVGNASLATGGSGDVLSGVVGALLAQGLTPLDAAISAVCLHGVAAEVASEQTGLLGLLAAELPPYIRELMG